MFNSQPVHFSKFLVQLLLEKFANLCAKLRLRNSNGMEWNGNVPNSVLRKRGVLRWHGHPAPILRPKNRNPRSRHNQPAGAAPKPAQKMQACASVQDEMQVCKALWMTETKITNNENMLQTLCHWPLQCAVVYCTLHKVGVGLCQHFVAFHLRLRASTLLWKHDDPMLPSFVGIWPMLAPRRGCGANGVTTLSIPKFLAPYVPQT